MTFARLAALALVFGFRTTMQRTMAVTRIDIGARFLERMCDRLEERAEASWAALDSNAADQAADVA